MAQFNAHFRNINGDDTYPLTDVIYRSKVDGSLLEVEHDRAALASKSPDEWKKLFAERRMSFEPADMSGIWSKREMVLPDMPIEDIVTMREGWSPRGPARQGTGHQEPQGQALRQLPHR